MIFFFKFCSSGNKGFQLGYILRLAQFDCTHNYRESTEYFSLINFFTCQIPKIEKFSLRILISNNKYYLFLEMKSLAQDRLILRVAQNQNISVLLVLMTGKALLVYWTVYLFLPAEAFFSVFNCFLLATFFNLGDLGYLVEDFDTFLPCTET